MKKVMYFFCQLTDLDLEWILANGRNETIPAGTVLISEGRPITALYFVLRGSLTVQLAPHHTELARLGIGEVVGEMSFLDASLPSATVVAEEETVVLTVPRAQLAAKLIQDVGLAARFYRAIALFLSDRLRHTNWHVAYGPAHMPDEDQSAQQFSPSVLAGAPAAGERFERMLERLTSC